MGSEIPFGPSRKDVVVFPQTGTWIVEIVEGAEVRLRSGRIGLLSVDVRAPVVRGAFRVSDQQIQLDLELALDQLRTSAFLLQGAARSLVARHHATTLQYRGLGNVTQPWVIQGPATAGDVCVDLTLNVSPWQPGADALGLELIGSANVGTVHLPLPGMGTVEDFSFDVDARLALGTQ
jgi:hypothetical protein